MILRSITKSKFILLLPVLSFFLLTFCVAVGEDNPGLTFHVSDPRDTFQFSSDAPLEKIVGTTNNIAGKVIVHPDDITENLQASFELDLATIETGIAERDKHLRNEYLETQKYPKAMLTVDDIIKVNGENTNASWRLEDKKSFYVTAQCTLNLHGVQKSIIVDKVKITYFKENDELRAVNMYGNILKIDATFKVNLSDYNIKRPQLLFLKLSEELEIKISMLASSSPLGQFWRS